MSQRSRGEMDITAGFEPAVGGSSPSESTKVANLAKYYILFSVRNADIV